MPRDHHYFVYLLASGRNGTLYCGVTNDLLRRVEEHASGKGGVFTRRYGVHRLVWCEAHQQIEQAIAREKAVKKMRRSDKLKMIEAENPRWRDLADNMQH